MDCIFEKVSDAQMHDVSFESDFENPEFFGSIRAETENLMKSESEYFKRTGNGENVPVNMTVQFAENLARSRQSDMCISEFGEPMVEISVKYTSQAIDAWRHIKNLLKGGETQ